MKSRYPRTAASLVWIAAALLIATLLPIGCGGTADDPVGSVGQEAVPPFTISGTIVDANSNPLSGATVRLAGSANATTTTANNGSYTFTGLGSGSYAVNPSRSGCVFVPTVVNLNNLNANRTANFAGFGASCGGALTNTGALLGLLTISGVVTDSAGSPVPGARIVLSGGTQAIRTTLTNGAYVFLVNPGTYTLTTGGSCSYSPRTTTLTNLRRSTVQNFVRSGCPAPDAGVGDSGARDAGADATLDGRIDAPTDARESGSDTGGDAPRDSALDAASDAPRDGASDAPRDVCIPTTCTVQGISCGTLPDGCGGTLQCGACISPQQCVNGQCCSPRTTCPAAQNCGTAADGCGGTLLCGTCSAPQTCGGGGTPNQCGCTPATSCPAGQSCGAAPDGCGGTIVCGSCTAPDTCGGGGVAGRCGSPCDISTTDCIQSRSADCLQCVRDNGCLDSSQFAGICEEVTGSAAACTSVLSTSSSPSETL